MRDQKTQERIRYLLQLAHPWPQERTELQQLFANGNIDLSQMPLPQFAYQNMVEVLGQMSFTTPVTLDLSENGIGVEDKMVGRGTITIIAPILKHASVKTLILRKNSIGSPGLEALIEALQGKQLGKLDLSENQFTDAEGNMLLTALQTGQLKVKQLNIEGNSISPEIMQQIETALEAANKPQAQPIVPVTTAPNPTSTVVPTSPSPLPVPAPAVSGSTSTQNSSPVSKEQTVVGMNSPSEVNLLINTVHYTLLQKGLTATAYQEQWEKKMQSWSKNLAKKPFDETTELTSDQQAELKKALSPLADVEPSGDMLPQSSFVPTPVPQPISTSLKQQQGGSSAMATTSTTETTTATSSSSSSTTGNPDLPPPLRPVHPGSSTNPVTTPQPGTMPPQSVTPPATQPSIVPTAVITSTQLTSSSDPTTPAAAAPFVNQHSADTKDTSKPKKASGLLTSLFARKAPERDSVEEMLVKIKQRGVSFLNFQKKKSTSSDRAFVLECEFETKKEAEGFLTLIGKNAFTKKVYSPQGKKQFSVYLTTAERTTLLTTLGYENPEALQEKLLSQNSKRKSCVIQ